MKFKIVFGVFVIVVIACLFFFFFSGAVRANGRVQVMPQPDADGALAASVYKYGSYSTGVAQLTGSGECYKYNILLSYVKDGQGGEYGNISQVGYGIGDYSYTGNPDVPIYSAYAGGGNDSYYAQVGHGVGAYRGTAVVGAGPLV